LWPGSVFRLWAETGELRAQELEACLRKAADNHLLLPDGERWILIVRRKDGNRAILAQAVDKVCDTMRRMFGAHMRWEILCGFEGTEDLARSLGATGPEPADAAASAADPAAFESAFRVQCGRGWAHARDFLLDSLLAKGAKEADARLLLSVLSANDAAGLIALFPPVRDSVFPAAQAAGEASENPEDSSAKRAVRAACEYIRSHCE
ncbi:MAG TPA: hypothetical protein PKE04_09915, partial [Clostridia bacterium]|nr:hypothetical protein [Clostridia bacterium]